MAYVKAVVRTLPDGSVEAVLPFHISFEGLEQNIICRDDSDCDAMVKIIAICAKRKNVIIIIYAVVSNHAHIAVLARNYWEAKAFAEDVKKMYSMYFKTKYGESKSLKGTDINVQFLDNDWYLRNALAYIPRNAYDNGATNLADYKWTGFRAFFRKPADNSKTRKVSNMSTREQRRIFHSGDNLTGTKWEVNENEELEPSSFCDVEYLEEAYNHDETFFFRSIGGLNIAEMNEKLVIAPRVMKTDADFLKELDAISERWFKTNVRNLAQSQKARILIYVYRVMKTTVAQMARTMGMEKDDIRRLLNLKSG